MEQVWRVADHSTLSQKAAAFCLLYSAMAFVLFPATFVDVLSSYPLRRFYVLIPMLVVVGLLAAAIRHAPARPVSFIRWKLRDRGQAVLAIFAVVVLSATAFTTLKHEYAQLLPFSADEALADMDEALHFIAPWRITHAIFPVEIEGLLFALYSQFWFLQVAGVLVYAAFIADRDTRERYFVAFALSVILLSSVVRIAASSAGPIFHDRLAGGDRFSDLTAALSSSRAGMRTLALADYLYKTYTSERTVLGTGISAMPSLHVALAVLNALFLTSRSVTAGRVAWIYAGIIMFGSVHFGWHYAVDGYIAILCVLMIWTFADTEDTATSRHAGTG